MIDDRRMAVLLSSERIASAQSSTLNRAKLMLGRAAAKLEALNPLSVISRGYSAVYTDSGSLVKTVDQLELGGRISFKTADGEASAVVDRIKKDNNIGE